MGNDTIPHQRDHRDLALQYAFAELVEKDERIASLEADVAVYYELTCVAFDALRELTVRRDRDREQHQHLRDEYQAFRERLLLQGEVTETDDVAA